MAHKVLITDIDTGKVVLDCVSSGYIYAVMDDEKEGIHATNYFEDIQSLEVCQLMDATDRICEDIRERYPNIVALEALFKNLLNIGVIKKDVSGIVDTFSESEGDAHE